MTTKIPRHGYVLSVDVSSVPVDISSSCGDLEYDPDVKLGEVYTADTPFRQTVEGGGKACVVTVSVIRTTGATEAYNVFNDWLLEANKSARTLTLDHPTSSNPSKRLTGEFSLLSFQGARRSPGSADAEILQAVLWSDGQFTHETIT